jgi:hypothetical protein
MNKKMNEKLSQPHFQTFFGNMDRVHSFGPNSVYIMNKGPRAIAHVFSNGLIQKERYHEVL